MDYDLLQVEVLPEGFIVHLLSLLKRSLKREVGFFGTRFLACGILVPDQGSNPCPLQ